MQNAVRAIFASASTHRLVGVGGNKRQHAGAALLSAMLTVTLVATFASAALWQQFRSVEIETAERGRQQSWLILTGALDWARLVLREDARSGDIDHLGEPWAVPLEEARLTNFLAVDGTTSDIERDAFLSGSITDMQSRFNLANLVEGSVKSDVGLASLRRLCELLDLAPQVFTTLSENYFLASKLPDGVSTASDFLQPQRIEQLTWLGIDAGTVALLAPHVTVLPTRSPVNLNTASALVIAASTPNLTVAEAEKLVAARERRQFSTIADAKKILANAEINFSEGSHSVSTRYFEVTGLLRLDQLTVSERSLVVREKLLISTVWRSRGAARDGAVRKSASPEVASREGASREGALPGSVTVNRP